MFKEETGDDGGPAFPVGDQSTHPLLTGMSLRDYFAAAALTGLLNSAKQGFNPEYYVEQANLVADTMLSARKSKGT